jgi:hypothetical protein
MPVTPVNKVANEEKSINLKRGAEEEETHLGSLTPKNVSISSFVFFYQLGYVKNRY